MPAKLERCVESVMKQGKDKDAAYAICNAQLKDSFTGSFRDAAVYDPKERTAVSVRDGVLEYLGVELGMEPPDRIIKVYRSPATISNTAMKMRGLPITDQHVTLDMDPPTDGGFVAEAEMIDAMDAATLTTIAIRNQLALSDTLTMAVESDKKELSLGYNADLVPYDGDEYDFEQRNIRPHHLAVVERGRCGPMCSFIDRLPSTNEEENKMPPVKQLHAAFCDQEGAMNLQQIVELATALPEAIKSVPVDQLQELLPALQQIVEAAKGVMPEENPDGEEEPPMEDEGDMVSGGEEDQPKQFGDEDVRKFTDEAIRRHAAVIEKARDFLPETYKFSDKSTDDIMRDALAVVDDTKFSDEELPLAFKLMKKPTSNYQQFGDAQPHSFDQLKDKEL